MSRKLEHIMCIDDDADILEIVQMVLEDIGHFRVTPLNRAENALSQILTLEPDLVLVDVMMPEMDGPSLLRALRAQAALTALPVVFMTARIQDAEVRDYLAQGADGVIPKPFNPMTLSDDIRAIWERLHG